MGSENDDLHNLDQPANANQKVAKKPKITYARDFLLSLSRLDLCKQLPNGFDKSILNEFHDAFHGCQEKTRTSGGFAAHSFRRTEYSASPPTKRDANTYSKGSTGKWESRSRDDDSQSDRDSESGRQITTHSRRPWQNSEHDGLLGSGSSSKLTGYTSGTSVPKFKANDQYHLNRSSAPYQPPRPCKAVPHNRNTITDLHNDETFGSAVITDEKQAEEERKRRAEFELMRKERHKSGQEKQYLSSVNIIDDLIIDATDYQGNLNVEKKVLNEGSESHKSSTVLAPHDGSTKSSTSIPTLATRPVVPPGFVPPGFANSSIVAKSAIKHDAKVRTSEMDDKLAYSTVSCSTDRNTDNNKVKQTEDPAHLNKANNNSTIELLVNGVSLDPKMGALQWTASAANGDFVTPFMEDIFGDSFTINGGGSSILTERQDGDLHAKCKINTTESSKFAPWFVEDDGHKQEDGPLSEKPIDLNYLIGGGPTSELISYDPKAAKTVDTSVPVLTCEDLEQSILSELGHPKVPLETLQQVSVSRDANVALPKAAFDDAASQHLLSVLHKETAPGDTVPSLNIDKESSDRQHLIESSRTGSSADGLKDGKVDKTSDMGKNSTLEALFGSAFMKELHADDAPISTKRESLINDSSKFQLPLNESLITGADPLNPSNSFHGYVDTPEKGGYASTRLPVENTDMLGALSAMFRDGRSSQDNQAFPHHSYGKMDNNNMYHSIRAHTSPRQLPLTHTSQGRPMFNQSDTCYPLPQMRFPDNMICHDQPPTHQFSPIRQVFHQPKPMRFEPPSQQTLMQQVHMQSNVPPPHLLRQYSGALAHPSHPYNQVPGFRQGLDRTQGFHVSGQQPGFGGLGISPSVTDYGSGNHHPDVLRRLMEMELRSNAKPNQPLVGHLGGLPDL